MEEEDDRRMQDLLSVGRGCHGRQHMPPDDPPQSGDLPMLQGTSLNPKESKLAKVQSTLRLEQSRGRRNLMKALGEREQYHSERLSRMEKHQECQIDTMTLQLTSLTRQLQCFSEQRQPPSTPSQPWRGWHGRPPMQDAENSGSSRGSPRLQQEVKVQINSEEARIRILDSPEERWIAQRLRIWKRPEERPIQVEHIQERVKDILRLRRPSSPDSDDQPGRPTRENELPPQRALTPSSRSPPQCPGSRLP